VQSKPASLQTKGDPSLFSLVVYGPPVRKSPAGEIFGSWGQIWLDELRVMSTLRSTIELAPNEKNAANEEPSEENEECILLGLHIYDPDHACAHSL